MNWQCGLTTVPARIDTTLPRTLNSLCDAGFGDVRLFVDGCDDPSPYAVFGRPVSTRPNPPVRIVGNWMMGLWELYVREPFADRYAMFQDDLLAVGNLREYLERCQFPQQGYWNLLTFEENRLFTNGRSGWNKSNRRGLGAVALVFDRDGVIELLSSKHLAHKPIQAKEPRRWKVIDGGIVEHMNSVGWNEYVHNPSLVQHIGHLSTLGNNRKKYLDPVDSFPGEHFDATELLL